MIEKLGTRHYAISCDRTDCDHETVALGYSRSEVVQVVLGRGDWYHGGAPVKDICPNCLARYGDRKTLSKLGLLS